MTLIVEVPSMLTHCLDDKKQITLPVSNLEEGFKTLWQTFPLLKKSCLTRNGDIRPHVLIFFNEDNICWLDTLDRPVIKGDRLTILQAVSGGS